MDTHMRGNIERYIDDTLTQSKLETANKLFSDFFSPMVGDIGNALFGYVIGRTLEFAFFSIYARYHRTATVYELKEIKEILERRSMEIKSKINTLTNK